MRPSIMTKPRLRRRLFAAGRIAPKARPCLYGHVGPYVDRPDLTAWMRQHFPDAGAQVDCLACGSSISAEAN